MNFRKPSVGEDSPPCARSTHRVILFALVAILWATGADPAQGLTALPAWIDQDGNALTASSLVGLNDADEVILQDGSPSAAIYSPVFDIHGKFSVIRSIDFGAFEDTTLGSGSREIIDQDAGTRLREVRIRTQTDAEGTFVQNPGISRPTSWRMTSTVCATGDRVAHGRRLAHGVWLDRNEENR